MAEILLVTSGKGGTGKSTVALLAGRALAAMGKNALLLELDCGLRGLDLLSGVSDKLVYDLSDVLTGRCAPVKAITPIETARGNLHLIAAPNDRHFLLQRKPLAELIAGLSGCYDFLLLDLGAGLGTAFDVASALCDLALVVSTCDPVSLRDANAAARALGNRPARLVLNKFAPRQLTGELSYIDDAIDFAAIQLISVIPQEEGLGVALQAGRLPAASAAIAETQDLARRLCGEDIPLDQKRLRQRR